MISSYLPSELNFFLRANEVGKHLILDSPFIFLLSPRWKGAEVCSSFPLLHCHPRKGQLCPSSFPIFSLLHGREGHPIFLEIILPYFPKPRHLFLLTFNPSHALPHLRTEHHRLPALRTFLLLAVSPEPCLVGLAIRPFLYLRAVRAYLTSSSLLAAIRARQSMPTPYFFLPESKERLEPLSPLF